MGLPEAAALKEVQREGYLPAPNPDPTAEFFERRFGFSESTARSVATKSVATRGGDRSAHLHARDVVLPGRDQADGDAGFRAIVEAKRRGGASTDRAALAEAVAHERNAGRGDHVPAWALDELDERPPGPAPSPGRYSRTAGPKAKAKGPRSATLTESDADETIRRMFGIGTATGLPRRDELTDPTERAFYDEIEEGRRGGRRLDDVVAELVEAAVKAGRTPPAWATSHLERRRKHHR